MNLGISILYKKEPPRPAEPFSFHKPLSHEIWMYTITAYAAVTCLIFLLSRFSPYEWTRSRRCVMSTEDNNVLENQFSIANSMWFTTGSLMQQGMLTALLQNCLKYSISDLFNSKKMIWNLYVQDQMYARKQRLQE